MTTQPLTESDLLLKFEQDNLPIHYKEYYLAKRQNFFANIQSFHHLWECFMLLDRIYLRELEDMKITLDINRMFPMILFLNAHAKMRVSLELGFSACLTEAHSILRDAVESIAHGHRLMSDPALLQPWLGKNDGEAGLETFKQEFWYQKEERVFDGLPKLHGLWKQYSEFGSRTNINSLARRFFMEESTTTLEWGVNYTGVKAEILAPALLEMLIAFHLMEDVLYRDCESRLKLDTELGDMRTKFRQESEAVKAQIIRSFKITHSPHDPSTEQSN